MEPTKTTELIDALKAIHAEQARKFEAQKAHINNIWAAARKKVEAKHVRTR